jgi:8-oxo-dGTP diphosphatase
MELEGAYSASVGQTARAVRSKRHLSQEQVAARMRALGFTGWLRQTVGQVERGKRRLIVDEVLALSFALEASVAELLMPSNGGEWVTFPNGRVVSVAIVRHSIRGNRAAGARWSGDTPVFPPAGPFATEPGPDLQYAALLTRLEKVEEQLRTERARNGHTQEEPVQPVITAIVISDLGVLVGHRNDGKPPWTFIAGEQEPGERIEDTAIREVKEETGLRIRVGDVIGQRVHPKTQRTMIYVAAEPTHGTDVIVGDEEELAEVRWVSLAEAEELMASYGMFDAVHEYLERTIGGEER